MGVSAQLSLSERTALTFRRDRIKGVCVGILESGWSTFGLLIAVRVFDASPALKATLASGTAAGYLLTPLILFLVAGTRLTSSAALGWLYAAAGIFLAVAACSNHAFMFIGGVLLSAVLGAQHGPFMVRVYSENYPSDRRGQLLSQSLVFAVLASTIFSFLAGKLLDLDLHYFRPVFIFMALCALAAGWSVCRMPSQPMSPNECRNPLRSLSYAWQDRIFGAMLFVWMLMGIGNLLTIPLRVEYMANPGFGINATNAQIALVTLVIPSLVRVFFTHLWGYCFDRYNFFVIRGLLNGCFLIAILIFFNSTSMLWLGVAGVFFGLAIAGGNIAWSLWVTKFAPPERVSEYMSVHTFMTGLRGVGAPFLGFYAITIISPSAAGAIAAGLIGLSMVLLDPVRRTAARKE